MPFADILVKADQRAKIVSSSFPVYMMRNVAASPTGSANPSPIERLASRARAPIVDAVQGLSVSPHLQVVEREDGSLAAFHSLFGNFSVLDHELAGALHRLGGLRGPIEVFQNALGAAIAAALLDAYYISDDQEERRVVEGWLVDRERKVSSGVYLGGLQITTSNACNLTCSYCFADASDARSPERRAGTSVPTMSFETARLAIDNVLATARGHGRERIAVKFLGREPLINSRVIQQLLDHYGSDEIAWSVTTNASLVTPELAAAFAVANVRAVVSIDGLAETNDALRVVKSHRGEQSSFVLAMRGLEHLARAGVTSSVSSVLSSATDFASMGCFLRSIGDAGCKSIEFTLAMQTNAYLAQSSLDGGDAFVDRLVNLYHEAAGQGINVSGDWVDPYHAILTNHKFRDESSLSRPAGVGCQATEHQISVEPNGDLFPCRAMSTYYGSLTDWDAVLRSDAYRDVVMRTYFAVPYCHGCQLEGHCQGTCLGSLEEASGDIYNPQDAYCAVYRSVTRALIRSSDASRPC